MDPQCKDGAGVYIDDGATAVLDSPTDFGMVSRAVKAVVMSLFVIFRPLDGSLEPIKRPYSAPIRKMLAKEGLKEIITFLG